MTILKLSRRKSGNVKEILYQLYLFGDTRCGSGRSAAAFARLPATNGSFSATATAMRIWIERPAQIVAHHRQQIGLGRVRFFRRLSSAFGGFLRPARRKVNPNRDHCRKREDRSAKKVLVIQLPAVPLRQHVVSGQ